MKEDIISWGKAVIVNEANAITNLTQTIDDTFVKICEILLACSGRVIVTGMGKSGHIGRKIAATLASTGTPSYYIHPAGTLIVMFLNKSSPST